MDWADSAGLGGLGGPGRLVGLALSTPVMVMRPFVTRRSISGPPPLSCDSSVRMRRPDVSSDVVSPLTVIRPFTERAFSVAFALVGNFERDSAVRAFEPQRRR